MSTGQKWNQRAKILGLGREHEGEQREHGKTKRELIESDELWEFVKNNRVELDEEDKKDLMELLDEILYDDDKLYYMTGLTREEFEYLMERFEKELCKNPS